MACTLRSLWRLLQSRNLAFVLLVVVTVGVVLASFIPQRSAFSATGYEAWKAAHGSFGALVDLLLLNQVYSAWWFLIALGLLLANTFVCSVCRVGDQLKGRGWSRLDAVQIARLRNRAEMESRFPVARAAAMVGRAFVQKGYRARSQATGDVAYLFGEKEGLTEWGSIIFHLSFLVVLIGVIYSGMTRQEGVVVITEGQVVAEERQGYLMLSRVPLLGESFRGFQVRLERFQPTYYQGRTGIDYAADVAVLEKGRIVERKLVRVNQPLDYRGVSFVLERYGFAPLFVLKDSEGRVLFDGYVNLLVLVEGAEDSFVIPGTGLSVKARFYPDMVEVDGHLSSRSLSPNNPVMYLTVSEAGMEVFEGPLPLNQSATVGDKALGFSGLRYWTQYRVVKDAAKLIVFSGFWLGVVGIGIRYLFTQKWLWAYVQAQESGARIALGGRAAQLDALYAEEFGRLVEGLRREVGHGSG